MTTARFVDADELAAGVSEEAVSEQVSGAETEQESETAELNPLREFTKSVVLVVLFPTTVFADTGDMVNE